MKVFTDGGCINNGMPGAKAAFAVYFPGGKPCKEISGLLKPNNYILENNKLITGVETYAPTNIRAEMFAIITALYYIKNKLGSTEVEIVTDSEFTINVLTKWISGWVEKKIIHKKANPDLLVILYNLYKYHKVKLTHQKSHTTQKTDNAKGNNYVDSLVTKCINNCKDYNILIL